MPFTLPPLPYGFDAPVLQIGVILQRDIEIGHVGAVVLVVVDPHRLLVDVGLQRRVVVGQRR